MRVSKMLRSGDGSVCRSCARSRATFLRTASWFACTPAVISLARIWNESGAGSGRRETRGGGAASGTPNEAGSGAETSGGSKEEEARTIGANADGETGLGEDDERGEVAEDGARSRSHCLTGDQHVINVNGKGRPKKKGKKKKKKRGVQNSRNSWWCWDV